MRCDQPAGGPIRANNCCLELRIERQQRKQLDLYSAPLAARRLAVVLDDLAVILRSPDETRGTLLVVAGQYELVTVGGLDQRSKSLRGLLRKRGAVDDQPDFRVAMLRAQIEVDRSDQHFR